MSDVERQTSIDALRGLAVLLMIMVHAAATWTPSDTSQLTLLASMVSGLGGLAAPLFVVLFGWGLMQRKRPWQERLRQASFLFMCQAVVNISAPHLFQPLTPGVLSLMGVMVLCEPQWTAFLRRSRSPFISFTFVMLVMLSFVWYAKPLQGPSNWSARIETSTLYDVGMHTLLTGTYPFVPWVLFGAFGATLALQPGRRPVAIGLATGMAVSVVILVHAIINETAWALPTGEASLTFFPANGPFLIAALTGVCLMWLVVEGRPWLHALAASGRCSLSLYVAHFVPLFWLHTMDEQGGWGLNAAMVATVTYTAAWMLLGTFWWKRWPRWTLESAWRRWSRPGISS